MTTAEQLTPQPTPFISFLSRALVNAGIVVGLYIFMSHSGHTEEYLKGWSIGACLWLIGPFTRYFAGRPQ